MAAWGGRCGRGELAWRAAGWAGGWAGPVQLRGPSIWRRANLPSSLWARGSVWLRVLCVVFVLFARLWFCSSSPLFVVYFYFRMSCLVSSAKFLSLSVVCLFSLLLLLLLLLLLFFFSHHRRRRDGGLRAVRAAHQPAGRAGHGHRPGAARAGAVPPSCSHRRQVKVKGKRKGNK